MNENWKEEYDNLKKFANDLEAKAARYDQLKEIWPGIHELIATKFTERVHELEGMVEEAEERANELAVKLHSEKAKGLGLQRAIDETPTMKAMQMAKEYERLWGALRDSTELIEAARKNDPSWQADTRVGRVLKKAIQALAGKESIEVEGLAFQKVVQRIRYLVEKGAKHKRGFKLNEVNAMNPLIHMIEEVTEVMWQEQEDLWADGDEEELEIEAKIEDELGDVLGCFLHYVFAKRLNLEKILDKYSESLEEDFPGEFPKK